MRVLPLILAACATSTKDVPDDTTDAALPDTADTAVAGDDSAPDDTDATPTAATADTTATVVDTAPPDTFTVDVPRCVLDSAPLWDTVLPPWDRPRDLVAGDGGCDTARPRVPPPSPWPIFPPAPVYETPYTRLIPCTVGGDAYRILRLPGLLDAGIVYEVGGGRVGTVLVGGTDTASSVWPVCDGAARLWIGTPVPACEDELIAAPRAQYDTLGRRTDTGNVFRCDTVP